MSTLEFIVAILGTNGVVLVINSIVELIKQKSSKKRTKIAEELSESVAKLSEKVSEIDAKLDVQTEGIKFALLPQLQAEGRRLCKMKTFTSKEYEQFNEMYFTYKTLGGDGYADMIKGNVDKKFNNFIDAELEK